MLVPRAAPEVATSVYPTPGLSSLTSAKVATPLTALTVRVPEIRDPGAGHGAVPTLIVTRPFGTTPPEESRIVAWTAGLMIASPSTVAGGCVVKRSEERRVGKEGRSRRSPEQ